MKTEKARLAYQLFRSTCQPIITNVWQFSRKRVFAIGTQCLELVLALWQKCQPLVLRIWQMRNCQPNDFAVPDLHFATLFHKQNNSRTLKHRLLSSLRVVNKQTLLCGSLIFIGLIMTPSLALASESALPQVTVRYEEGAQVEGSTSAGTVRGALADMQIQLKDLEFALPAMNAAVHGEHFNIEIQQKRWVIVRDGQKELKPELTTADNPIDIVQDLGYRLGDKDTAAFSGRLFVEEMAEQIPLVQIIRADDYKISINGATTVQQSLAATPAGILKDLGYPVDELDYIKPALTEKIEKGETIFAYYNQPNQRIITLRKTEDNINQIIEKEQTVWETLDPSGKVSNSEVLEEQVISVTTKTPPATTTKTKRILSQGELTAQQESWLRQAGIAEKDWEDIDYIIHKESRWRHDVKNPRTSAWGLCQTMMSVHSKKKSEYYISNTRAFKSDPVEQLKWCDNYAKHRYGSWKRAVQAWKSKRWW